MSPNAIESPDLNTLKTTLTTGNLKDQLQVIRKLSAMPTLGEQTGEQMLIEFVREGIQSEPTAAHGSAYQWLYESVSDAADLPRVSGGG